MPHRVVELLFALLLKNNYDCFHKQVIKMIRNIDIDTIVNNIVLTEINIIKRPTLLFF